MNKSFYRKNWVNLIALLFLISLVFLRLLRPDLIQRERLIVFDTYQKLQPRIYQPISVKTIEVDDDSLKLLGQWPWPRTRMAELVTKLADAGVMAIGFDVLFSEPDNSSPHNSLKLWKNVLTAAELEKLKTKLANVPTNDERFAQAVAKNRVVLSFAKTSEKNQTRPVLKATISTSGLIANQGMFTYQGATKNLDILEKTAAGNGSFELMPEVDSINRRLPLVVRLNNQYYPSLALELFRVIHRSPSIRINAQKSIDNQPTAIESISVGDQIIPTDAEGNLLVYYTRKTPQRKIPIWRVLTNKLEPNELRGQIVIVGTSAAGLKDLKPTPLNGDAPDIEIHANALEQMLSQNYLYRPAWVRSMEIMAMTGASLFLILFLSRLGSVLAVVVPISFLISFFAGAWYGFRYYHWLIDPLYPAITVLTTYSVISLLNHLTLQQERDYIRHAFSRYVSPNKVKHLIENPDSLALGGEYRECSFVMTDLAGFTSLMEKYPPHECVAMLNDYLEGMVNIAFKYNGTLDRIVGDAVAVIFSAPIVQPNHCQLALECAMEMDKYAMQFVSDKGDQGIKFGITRIGVCTGKVLVGNFGGKTMLDYRALGDPINTASRLESVNKQFGTRICVADSTFSQSQNLLARPVGWLVLKGKHEKTKAYELLTPEQFNAPVTADYLAAYEKMEAQDITALDDFAVLVERYPDDPLCRYHYDRLQTAAQLRAKGDLNQEIGSTIVLSNK